MRGSPAIPFVDRAEAALRAGKSEQALKEASEALKKHSDFAPAILMRGIAYAQLGQTDDAKRDLRRAIELNRQDHRAYINLSALLLQEGDLKEAARMARETLGLKRDDPEAIAILEKCGDKRFKSKPAAAAKSDKDGGPEAVPVRLPLPKGWLTGGYVLLGLSFLCFLTWTIRNPLMPQPSTKGMAIAVHHDALGFIEVMLLPLTALFQFTWAFVDVLDRQKRFVWLLPMFISPVLGATHFIPFALYLFVGRRAKQD